MPGGSGDDKLSLLLLYNEQLHWMEIKKEGEREKIVESNNREHRVSEHGAAGFEFSIHLLIGSPWTNKAVVTAHIKRGTRTRDWTA